MSEKPEIASTCPLCGTDNCCALSSAQPAEASTKQLKNTDSYTGCSKNSLDCWCTVINLDPQQKTLLKTSTDGTRCICQSCLLKLAEKRP